MLKIGRKYNAGISVLKVSKEVKESMVIWHHPAVINNYYWNKRTSRCLRLNHNIYTVKETKDYALSNINDEQCGQRAKCKRMANKLLELLPEKYNPLKETPRRDDLDHTKRRIEKYGSRDIKEKRVRFNPDITARGPIQQEVRIFKESKTYKARKGVDTTMRNKPAYRNKQAARPKNRPLRLFTDGSSKNNKAGIGVWRGNNSRYNRALKVPEGNQDNQRAEILGLIAA
ncbi:hypothetical protein BD311DRAFT_707238, partial [Dichomitus squalens]